MAAHAFRRLTVSARPVATHTSVRGRREAEEIVICTGVVMRAMQITFKVTECPGTDDQQEPSYHELSEQSVDSAAGQQASSGRVHPANRSGAGVTQVPRRHI